MTLPRVLGLAFTLAIVAAIAACGGREGSRGAGGGGGAGAAGGNKGGGGAPEAIEVRLGDVQHRSLEDSVAVTGTLFADEDTVVSARLPGRIVEVLKDVGDQVAPDEKLAQIERRDYELALDERRADSAAALAKIGLTALPGPDFDVGTLPAVVKARAEASNAEAKFERARQLFEQKPPLIAEQDFADIQTAREVARNQAEVELLTTRAQLSDARAMAAAEATARQRLDDTEVDAPAIEGRPDLRYRVAERRISVGEFVEAGRPLFRLVSTERIKYRVQVPERYGGRVRPGQVARVSVAGGARVEGRVSRVSPVVDPASRTFVAEISLDNADGALKPGSFAEGSIVLGMDDNTPMVPEGAVVTFAGVRRVFTVADGKAVEHHVTTGRRADGLVEIVDGLGPGPVVVDGAPGLSAGAPVKVRKE